jgi:MoaE-MoaD fusion protein
MADEPLRVRLLFFATLRDRMGTASLEELLPGSFSVAELRDWLAQRHPQIADNLPTTLIAINHTYAADDERIPQGAEIALFPPVSGGAGDPEVVPPTIFAITEAMLDLDDLLAQITLPTTGAACIFTGMVRGQTSRDREFTTEYLEYEAYRPMAEAKMKQVAEEIRGRWPSVEGIAIVQRIGVLIPSTPTVLIACTAAHRDTGVFEAARYGIDRLKQIVPVWKKEVGPDGEVWVEGDYHPEAGE